MGTKTYLSYVNEVLADINEPALTSSNFASAVGIPNTVKNAVNRAVRDTVTAELEWPFAVTAEYTQTLTPGTGTYALQTYRSVDWDSFFVRPTSIVTNGEFTSNITSWTDISGAGGTAAYTATGNGRLRLTGTGSLAGAATQALTTVIGDTYAVMFRHLGNDVTVKVGTTSGGTEISSEVFNLDDDNDGTVHSFNFVATATSTYLTFSTTSATAADIDFVRVRWSTQPRKLKFISFDEWRKVYRERDYTLSADSFGIPLMVFPTKDDKFGVTPVPKRTLEVYYDYWGVPTDMSVYSDTCSIPDRYSAGVVAGAKTYAYETLSDPVFRDRAKKDWEGIVKRMRVELLNKKDEMVVR